jgi:hypothetical protein
VRVALGLKARTGRAVLVAIGGDVREPRFIERSQMPLLPAGAFAPYHAAEGLEPEKARESVKESVAAAHRLAEQGIRQALKRIQGEPCGCAVLVGNGMPKWSTEEILAVHVRMHQAEGELFREVLVAGARSCGLALTTLPDKSALDAAAKKLGMTPAQLDATLRAFGKSAGAPWGKDQKEAAAAALVALKA